jgi:hypothetical protein
MAELIGTSLHLHLHLGLPIAFHSAMDLTLPARELQSGQWVPVLVSPSSFLVVACSKQPRTSIIRLMMMRECDRCVKEGYVMREMRRSKYLMSNDVSHTFHQEAAVKGQNDR